MSSSKVSIIQPTCSHKNLFLVYCCCHHIPPYKTHQKESTWSSIEYMKVAMCSGFHISTQTCCNWRPNKQENKQFKSSSQNLNECTLNARLPQQHQDLQLHIPFDPHRQTSCALFRVHPLILHSHLEAAVYVVRVVLQMLLLMILTLGAPGAHGGYLVPAHKNQRKKEDWTKNLYLTFSICSSFPSLWFKKKNTVSNLLKQIRDFLLLHCLEETLLF